MTFFIYGWTFPLLVPLFSVMFGIVGPCTMWKIEECLYKFNTDQTFLFSHLRRSYAKLNAQSRLYNVHPFMAGISLLSIYGLVCLKFSRSLFISYIITSTLMAYYGMRLVGTMLASESGRTWVKIQAILLLSYNALATVCVLTDAVQERELVTRLALWLLLCSGVGERMYVMFVLPYFERPLVYYSLQFKMATLFSVGCGLMHHFLVSV